MPLESEQEGESRVRP